MFSDHCFNEMHALDGSVRPHYGPLSLWLAGTNPERLKHMRQAAQMLFHRVGIPKFLLLLSKAETSLKSKKITGATAPVIFCYHQRPGGEPN